MTVNNLSPNISSQSPDVRLDTNEHEHDIPHSSTKGPSAGSDPPTRLSTHSGSDLSAEVIVISDNDEENIVGVYSKHSGPRRRCPGYVLTFPPGQTPHSSYPYALHDTTRLPWGYEVVNDTMILRPPTCTGKAQGDTCCKACGSLETNEALIGIKNRSKNGVHENAPFAYHSIGGMMTIARRKGRQIDELRLRKLNIVKKLKGKEGALDGHKQMKFALADKNIPRLNSLLRTARRRKLGLFALIGLIKRAAKGVYHPKNYEEEDDLQALLLLRLGGARVTDIAHRIHGSPAASTVRRRTTVPILVPSPSSPKTKEIETNIRACFQSISDVLGLASSSAPLHAVLMFDELATERRLRYDDRTNMFVGIGREDASKTMLEFASVEDLDTICEDVERGEVKLASEVRNIILSGTKSF